MSAEIFRRAGKKQSQVVTYVICLALFHASQACASLIEGKAASPNSGPLIDQTFVRSFKCRLSLFWMNINTLQKILDHIHCKHHLLSRAGFSFVRGVITHGP